MALACSIVPKVRNKNGELSNSRLFEDTLTATNDRDLTKGIWAISKTIKGDDVARDINNEPTLEATLQNDAAVNALGLQTVKDTYNKVLRDRSEQASVQSALRKADEANNFNNTNSLSSSLIANVTVDDNRVSVVLEEPNDSNTDIKERLKSGNAINTACVEFCERHGISIEALTEAEEGAGVEAVADLSAVNRIGDGLVSAIRIGRGEKAVNALPEEVCHIVTAHLDGKDAVVTRLLDVLRNNEDAIRSILGDEYDEYLSRYNGDVNKMAHEAAGHLVNEQMLEMKTEHLPEYKSLLRRFWDAILSFFKSISKDSKLERDIAIARQASATVAKNIVNDVEEWHDIDLSKEIADIGKLFALAKKTEKSLDDTFNKIKRALENQDKALARSGKRAYGRRLHVMDTLKTFNSTKESDSYEVMKTILSYVNGILTDLDYQLSNWNSKEIHQKGKVKERLFSVNTICNSCDTYTKVKDDLKKLITEIRKDDGSSADELKACNDIDNVLKEVGNKLDDLKAISQTSIIPAIVEYTKLFMNDVITVNIEGEYGRHRGEQISLEDALKHSDSDISVIEMWLSSGSMSTSLPVAMITKLLHRLKEQVREESNHYIDLIKEIALRAEDRGVNDFEFMYKRDKDGKLTGEFITKPSAEYNALSQAQKDFYDAIIDIKRQLDDKLPDRITSLFNAPKVRKDFFEVLKNSKDNKWSLIKNKIKELWTTTSDDEYTLTNDSAILTYDDKKMHVIPLRFIKFAEDEDMGNMSTDIVETMSMYAQMTCNYEIMTDALPVFDAAAREMKNGTVGKRAQKDDEGNVITSDSTTKRGEGSHEVQMLESILDMLVDGMLINKATVSFGNKKFDATRLGHITMAITALNQYAGNLMGGAQNEITGLIMGLSEGMTTKAFAKHAPFNLKDLMWAHKEYVSNLIDLAKDFGARNKTTKISLFTRKFNVMQQDNEKENFNRKTRVEQTVNSRTPYYSTEIGEHNLHHLTALAVAHHTILKDKNGNDISLWDALEVVDLHEEALRKAEQAKSEGRNDDYESIMKDIAAHPEWKNSKVKALVLQRGVKTTYGANVPSNFYADMTRKIAKLNFRMHGIYNKMDRSMIQRYVFGQHLIMYRKWMYPAIQKRLDKAHRDFDTGMDVEGTWTSAFKFFSSIFSDMKHLQFDIVRNWKNLSEYQKSNCMSAFFEWTLWVVLLMAGTALWRLKKRDRSFNHHYLYYFITRTRSELGFYNPAGFVHELLRIFHNPMATLPIIESTLGMVGLLNPWNYETFNGEDAIVQSGDFKGYSYAQKILFKSPLAIGRHQWMSFLHPERGVKFYE